MLQINDQKYKVRHFSNGFLLLENINPDADNLSIGEAILNANYSFITEVIATEVEICLKLTDHYKQDSLKQLEHIELPKITDQKHLRLPVCFENQDDWNSVLDHTKIHKEKFIEQLLQTDYTIAMFGFLPGFIYFNGLKESLHVPRKNVPSKHVKTNSLAIGGKYLGFYSIPSPGGWHIIGQSPVHLFDINTLPPVTISKSAKIKLKQIDVKTYDELIKMNLTILDYNDSY